MWFKRLPIINVLLLLPIFLNASLVQSEWHTEGIDTPRRFSEMIDRSIAISGDGIIHIAYGEDHLYHAHYDGAWNIETVDSSSNVGRYASVALDSNDKVHISYLDDSNDDLKYITNATGAWVVETVDSTGRVGWYTSIAIDSQDKVHISN